jgi:hypothetical protein
MQIRDKLPIYRCSRVPAGFEIDGDLTKSSWLLVPAIELHLAATGGIPSQSTNVRGCWDGEDLYLAFECQDEEIRATFTQRDDRVWLEEAVEAFIAPYSDLRHYYEFQCSPTNVVRDVKVTNVHARPDTAVVDGSWDCNGWRTAVQRQLVTGESSRGVAGWNAEWRIPLNALLEQGTGPILPGGEWRINLFRIDRWPREEYSSWSVTPGQPFSFHRPMNFGRWIFE